MKIAIAIALLLQGSASLFPVNSHRILVEVQPECHNENMRSYEKL